MLELVCVLDPDSQFVKVKQLLPLLFLWCLVCHSSNIVPGIQSDYLAIQLEYHSSIFVYEDPG